MRYVFNPGTDSSLNEAANWSPAGGPPGAGDLAVFGANSGQSGRRISGSATVGTLEFQNGNFIFAGANVTATSRGGTLLQQAGVIESGSTLTTRNLTLQGSGIQSTQASLLQTGQASIVATTDQNAFISVEKGSRFSDAGNLLLTPAQGGEAYLAVDGRATIRGSIIGAAGDPNALGYSVGIGADGGVITVDGNVVLSTNGAMSADYGGVIQIDGNLQLSTNGTGRSDISVSNSRAMMGGGGTIDVGHNLVLGMGATLSDTGGLVVAGDKLAILDGASATLEAGTIDARTITVGAMGFLGAIDVPRFPSAPPSVVAGVDNGATTIFNAGTINSSSSLTVTGDIQGHGTLLVGEPAKAIGDLTVNGTIAGQDVQFGKIGSELFADHFGTNAVQNFAAGDIIASPGIQSIAWDPTSHTLSMDKGGGTVESLHMAGEFVGQQFTLSDNEYITLQPIASQA